MIRICFAGITGWTAPPILAAIEEADDLTVVAGVSRSAAGRSLTDVTGLSFDGAVFANLAEALQSTAVDVVIDYTSATIVKDNALAALAAGVHLVIGSSGLTAEDYR
jgi:4-hydroxy-tetrahydrodipicolinate reductase